MRHIGGAIAAIAILLVGLLGTVIAVLDLVGVDYRQVFNKPPEDIALLILALIATTLGIEHLVARWGDSASTTQLIAKIAAIEGHLLESAPVRRVTGAPAIYSNGTRLVKLAHRQIRSIVVGHPNKTSMDYTRAVAARLKELKDTGAPARLDAVVIAEQKQFDIEFLRRSTADKVGIYKQAGLAGLAQVFHVGGVTWA